MLCKHVIFSLQTHTHTHTHRQICPPEEAGGGGLVTGEAAASIADVKLVLV